MSDSLDEFILMCLCSYDKRHPLHEDLISCYEEGEFPDPRTNCFCDSCHKGTDPLAVEILRLRAELWEKVWMPESYTCGCGIHVHPSRRNDKAIHIDDCPHAQKRL